MWDGTRETLPYKFVEANAKKFYVKVRRFVSCTKSNSMASIRIVNKFVALNYLDYLYVEDESSKKLISNSIISYYLFIYLFI